MYYIHNRMPWKEFQTCRFLTFVPMSHSQGRHSVKITVAYYWIQTLHSQLAWENFSNIVVLVSWSVLQSPWACIRCSEQISILSLPYPLGSSVADLEGDEDSTISDADSEKVDRVINSLPITDKGATAAEAQGEHLLCIHGVNNQQRSFHVHMTKTLANQAFTTTVIFTNTTYRNWQGHSRAPWTGAGCLCDRGVVLKECWRTKKTEEVVKRTPVHCTCRGAHRHVATTLQVCINHCIWYCRKELQICNPSPLYNNICT